jgi:hypothetical protein
MYFKSSMFVRKVLELPAQTKKDMQIFKVIFDHFACKKVKIFEWGSGFSTMYYADYLQRRNADFEWHSIDNNESWHERIKSMIKKKGLLEFVRLYVEEFPPFWEKSGWDWKHTPPACGIFGPRSEGEKSYIDFPKSLGKKFDIIIIDARFRRHCLKTAKEALASGGVVIMHDAQKTHYHQGLDDFQRGEFFETGTWYPFQEVPNKIWVGSMGNTAVFEILYHFRSMTIKLSA